MGVCVVIAVVVAAAVFAGGVVARVVAWMVVAGVIMLVNLAPVPAFAVATVVRVVNVGSSRPYHQDH